MCSTMKRILRATLFEKPTNFSVLQRFSFATDAELLDLFLPKVPVYDKELVVDGKKNIREKEQQAKEKKKDIIIKCHRPEFNHYRNQKYDKFKAIPFASKGWFHSKSIGDHFSIRIFSEDYDINNHFWDENVDDFNALKLDDLLIQALERVGFSRPTKIQADSIPVILSGKNTLIAAETGCGKTLAYLIPVIQQILKWKQASSSERQPNTPLAIVISPSRELAAQIGKVANELSHHLPFSSHVVIGGRTKQKMLHPEFKNVDLLVATLGALSKLTSTGIYNVAEVKHLILDESDTLLDDSFNELLLRYLKRFKIRYAPGHSIDRFGCQLILASATFPSNVDNLLSDFVEPGSLKKVTSKHLHRFLPHIPQTFYRIGPTQKATKILQIGKQAVKNKEPTMIFSRGCKSSTSDWISLMLNENDVPTLHLNGEMPILLRKGKFDQFRYKEFMILSCTDIVSRGMDTKHVKHVVNYDFPLYMADYIHRCGRTGRCGSSLDCRVTNFVSGKREVELVNKIEMAVRTMDVLPNVNANITRIIDNRIIKKGDNR
ncbi:probable ATP-dependent RNA helicase DDX28 [Halyomorpha halys]|uniref:probable ATP-dependent RNA helicase DDX28 n=1 Tax=Halyomorpha halys TaxID=286706 RepID=UPI000D0C8ECE|nr:probable ATP-dependent RNA helicase DDX28 [Halyomorpha halys]